MECGIQVEVREGSQRGLVAKVCGNENGVRGQGSPCVCVGVLECVGRGGADGVLVMPSLVFHGCD